METMKLEYLLSEDLLHLDFGEELEATKEVHDKKLEVEKIFSDMGDKNITGLKMHNFMKRKERYGQDLAELGIDIDLDREVVPFLSGNEEGDTVIFTVYKIDGRWQRVY